MTGCQLALRGLPPKLRAVVVLRDVYDLPHEAIAAELGISESAAKVRLHRARRRLREDLFPLSRRAIVPRTREDVSCGLTERVTCDQVVDAPARRRDGTLSLAARGPRPCRVAACAARPRPSTTGGSGGACAACAPTWSSRPRPAHRPAHRVAEGTERRAARSGATGRRVAYVSGIAATAAGVGGVPSCWPPAPAAPPAGRLSRPPASAAGPPLAVERPGGVCYRGRSGRNPLGQ